MKEKIIWTPEDVNYLMENYEELGPEIIAMRLKKNYKQVCNKVAHLRKDGKDIPFFKRSYNTNSCFQMPTMNIKDKD